MIFTFDFTQGPLGILTPLWTVIRPIIPRFSSNEGPASSVADTAVHQVRDMCLRGQDEDPVCLVPSNYTTTTPFFGVFSVGAGSVGPQTTAHSRNSSFLLGNFGITLIIITLLLTLGGAVYIVSGRVNGPGVGSVLNPVLQKIGQPFKSAIATRAAAAEGDPDKGPDKVCSHTNTTPSNDWLRVIRRRLLSYTVTGIIGYLAGSGKLLPILMVIYNVIRWVYLQIPDFFKGAIFMFFAYEPVNTWIKEIQNSSSGESTVVGTPTPVKKGYSFPSWKIPRPWTSPISVMMMFAGTPRSRIPRPARSPTTPILDDSSSPGSSSPIRAPFPTVMSNLGVAQLLLDSPGTTSPEAFPDSLDLEAAVSSTPKQSHVPTSPRAPRFNFRLWIATPPRAYPGGPLVIPSTPPSASPLSPIYMNMAPLRGSRSESDILRLAVEEERIVQEEAGIARSYGRTPTEQPTARRLFKSQPPRIVVVFATPPRRPDGTYIIPTTPPSRAAPSSPESLSRAPLRASRSEDDHLSAATEMDMLVKEISQLPGEAPITAEDDEDFVEEHASRKLAFRP